MKTVSDAAKAIKVFLLVVLSVLLSVSLSCYKSTDDDRTKLEELEAKFGDRYTFSLSSDGIYVYANLKEGAALREGDGEGMYRLFMFKNFAKQERRNTPYVYINLYDAKRNFLHQIYYDPKVHNFRREYKREHY